MDTVVFGGQLTVDPPLLSYEQLAPLILGEGHSHLLMDTREDQVNFSLLIRKAKAFPGVPQWANSVTRLSNHSFKWGWEHVVCPTSILEGSKGEWGQPVSNGCHNLEIELLRPWRKKSLHFNWYYYSQSLSAVVSIYSLYQRPFRLLSLPSGFLIQSKNYI